MMKNKIALEKLKAQAALLNWDVDIGNPKLLRVTYKNGDREITTPKKLASDIKSGLQIKGLA